MPTYDFVLAQGQHCEHSRLQLLGDEEAWREARLLCGKFVKDEPDPARAFRFRVFNEVGHEVLRITVAAGMAALP
jgi:hypothetical protein